MTDGDRAELQGRTWHPRFYAMCAVSVALLTAMTYALNPGIHFVSFGIGYGVASVFALLFIAIQTWGLRGVPQEDSA